MRVITADGAAFSLGTTEMTPTVSIIDYSRRETDQFGVTTVVERGFARRLSVRLSLTPGTVDAVQRRLAALRATEATWEADPRFAWLRVRGFYKDFTLGLTTRTLSYCQLNVEGLAETETGADPGTDPALPGGRSTLRLLAPVALTDAMLVSSTIPENDAPAWSSATAYALGAKVVRSRRVFESLKAGNQGEDPATGVGGWLDTGPTNRWAMFDQALGTVASAAGQIRVALSAGAIDALALLDVVGATVRVQAGAYDRTQAVGEGAITFLDMPATSGQVTVTIAGSGTVSVGTLLVGRLYGLGRTEAQPTAGITDFSRKEVDDFGEVTVVPRAWAKRMEAKALIRTDALDVVANRIAAVRARPCLWIGLDGLDSLTVYGFWKDFSIEVGTTSKLSLSIEGLSTAAKVEGLKLGVDWEDVGDPTGTKPTNNADKTGENVSADTAKVGGRDPQVLLGEVDALKGGAGTDSVPPAIPTGLALSSAIRTDPASGRQTIVLSATWNANTDSDLAGYLLAIRETATGNPIEFTVGPATPRYEREVQPNTLYFARVRAFDRAGNPSGYSGEASATSLRDTSPPAVPTGLTAQASLSAAYLRWTNPADADLAVVEIWEGEAGDSGQATRIATASARSGAPGAFTRTALAAGAVRHYWLKAVDTSGNASGFSTGASVTVAAISAADFTPGLRPIETITAAQLPPAGNRGRVVYFEGKLYADDGEKWVGSGAAAFADLTGTIANSQVGAGTFTGDRFVAGTIQAAQLAVDAVTASKAFLGDTSNLVRDGLLVDRDYWTVDVPASDWRLVPAPAGVGYASRNYLALPVHPTANRHAVSRRIPVEGGQPYYLQVIGVSTNGGRAYAFVRWYADAAGTSIIADNIISDKTNAYRGHVDRAGRELTAPANAVAASLVFASIAGFGSGEVHFAEPIMRRSNTAELIVDGAVVSRHITVGTLNGDRVAIDTLDGNRVRAATMTADRFSAGTLARVANNLVDTAFWGVESPQTDRPNGSSRFYWNHGPSNAWYDGLSPTAGMEKVLRMVQQSGVEPGGGWNLYMSPESGWSPERTYRYYTWVYSAPGNNIIYHGCEHANHLGGGAAPNPYFHSYVKNSLPTDRWLLMVGVVHGAGSTYGDTGQSGVWDSQTGRRILAGSDYRWRPGAPAGVFRSYQYYGDGGGVAYFTEPVVEEVISGRINSIVSLLQSVDYATNINTGATAILPGRILIQGGTTLDSWRDQTEIRGGAIKANSVSVEKLTINGRGISVIGCDFEAGATDGRLYWRDGYILWTSAAGAPASVYVPAGSVSWAGGSFNYIFWDEGASGFTQGRDNWETAQTANSSRVLMCTWRGGVNFVANHGGTIIHGDRITTRTIKAVAIDAQELSAITANLGTVTAGMVRNASGSVYFDVTNGRIVMNNGTVMKVSGSGFGTANQFIEWIGPTLPSISQCSEANAVYYVTTRGGIFTKTSLIAGAIKGAAQNASLAASVTADTGPVGSDGGQVQAIASWSASRSTSRIYGQNELGQFRSDAQAAGATTDGSGYWSGGREFDAPATKVAVHKEGVEQVSVTVTKGFLSFQGYEPVPGDASGSSDTTTSYSGAVTFPDPELATRARSWQAVLTRGGITVDSQRVSIAVAEPPQ